MGDIAILGGKEKVGSDGTEQKMFPLFRGIIFPGLWREISGKRRGRGRIID